MFVDGSLSLSEYVYIGQRDRIGRIVSDEKETENRFKK
jgi:hypothetical protein